MVLTFQEKLKEVQHNLAEYQLTGWLLYDFHGSNPLAYTFLEILPGKMLSRRFFYWIPHQGEPVKIVPLIESYTLDHLPGQKWLYRTWQELEGLLSSIVTKQGRIAMEYSPYNALPAISKVDAGTIDLLRRQGAEIVSSANLLQKYTSVWTEDQLKSHQLAAHVLSEVVDLTWAFIAHALQMKQSLNEYQVQQFMLREMSKRGCLTAEPPLCAVNMHSANPHYVPYREAHSSSIQVGDFILLDLWCKQKAPSAVYADITRVGVASDQPSPRQQEIFNIVKQARDAATHFIRNQYEGLQTIEGWQVDQVCRDIITQAGYGEYFIHRTGHNIGEDVHGPGANLDNFETHDFRRLLPGTCFSVEPGIYLPNEFGVRLEYNVYLSSSHKMIITGGIQEEIVCLLCS